jgi:hypothetical protein
MELITLLNRCHRFRGFVYQHAYFSADKKSIEVAVRPRKGSAAVCSRCHLPAPGYDHLVERRFEFIPLWGLRAKKSGSFAPQHTTARGESPLGTIALQRRSSSACADVMQKECLPSLDDRARFHLTS